LSGSFRPGTAEAISRHECHAGSTRPNGLGRQEPPTASAPPSRPGRPSGPTTRGRWSSYASRMSKATRWSEPISAEIPRKAAPSNAGLGRLLRTRRGHGRQRGAAASLAGGLRSCVVVKAEPGAVTPGWRGRPGCRACCRSRCHHASCSYASGEGRLVVGLRV